MNKMILISTLLLITSIHLMAQSEYRFNAGLNHSSFYNEQNGGWINGIYIGIGKYYNLHKNFGTSVYIIYEKKGGVLVNKIIKPYRFGSLNPEVYKYDITALINFIQIPVNFELVVYKSNYINIEAFCGYFIAIPVADDSQKNAKEIFSIYDLNDPESGYISFDYMSTDVSGFGVFDTDYKLNQGYRLGARLKYGKYFLEILYTRDIQIYGYLDIALSAIKKSTHSINFLLGIIL